MIYQHFTPKFVYILLIYSGYRAAHGTQYSGERRMVLAAAVMAGKFFKDVNKSYYKDYCGKHSGKFLMVSRNIDRMFTTK
jgi:hypothetical protein